MSKLTRGLKKLFSIFGYSVTRIKSKSISNIPAIATAEDIQFKWISNYGFKSVIDIGANVGQFAMKIRKLLPDADVYSFEPLPIVFDELVSNFKDDSRFKAYNFALGALSEEKTIYLNKYSPSSSLLKMEEEHKIHFEYAREESPIDIEIRVLDEVFENVGLKEPILIKLDVQGFEKQVINGGNRTLSKCKMLIIEMSFKELYQGQPLFDEMYHKLKEFGFQYCGNYEQLLSPIDGEILQVDGIFIK
jgi:FkbM family methyltransferase